MGQRGENCLSDKEKIIEESIKKRASDMAKAICENKDIQIRHSKEKDGISIFESHLKKMK